MEPRRRNSYRLPEHDYADGSYAYFLTLDTKVEHVKQDSQIDPDAPFTSCLTLGQQANDGLLFYRNQGKLLIFAYCLMPDHLHILASPQNGANLSSVLSSYESFTTRAAWQYGVIGALWHRSFYDHILRRSDDTRSVIEYILNNPVKAGLVESWQEWPWCGMLDAR